MASFSTIFAQGAALTRRSMGDSDTILDLMMALLGIAFFALLLVSALFILRRMKRQQRMRNETLPQYNDVKYNGTRRLTIQTADGRSSILVTNGRAMLADPQSPPHSPNNIPEIHITFPDEHDDLGHRKGGRVVVVRVGETTIGLEPVKEELPAYEKESKHGFYSIDMDQIGGLKEKDPSLFR